MRTKVNILQHNRLCKQNCFFFSKTLWKQANTAEIFLMSNNNRPYDIIIATIGLNSMQSLRNEKSRRRLLTNWINALINSNTSRPHPELAQWRFTRSY